MNDNGLPDAGGELAPIISGDRKGLEQLYGQAMLCATLIYIFR